MPSYPVTYELLRLDSPARDDMVTDGAMCLLAEHGAAGLTVQALADWCGLTRPALNQRLSRAGMHELVARRFAHRWVGWVGRYVTDHDAQELFRDAGAADSAGWPEQWPEGWPERWPEGWPEGWALAKRGLAMLPQADDEVAGLRAWHALATLGITVPTVATVVAEAEVAERRLLERTAPWLAAGDVMVLDIVLRGLRARLAATHEALSTRCARGVLLRHLAQLRGP